MDELKRQEMQRELFEEFSKETKRVERLAPLARSQKPILFSTTLEHLLLGCILLILSFCLVFFLGVLRGKSLVENTGGPPQAISSQPPAPLPSERPLQADNIPKSAAPAVPKKSRGLQSLLPISLISKPYTIQLVTHKKKENAETEVASLKRSGYTSFILTSGGYYLVCVGQYASKEEAKKDLRFFGGRFKGCFLRRK